jgi:hypothetical protein
MLFRLLHPRFIKQFEDDARTQVKLNLTMTYFWIVMILASVICFFPHDVDALIQLLILEVSLYANVVTHYGALSSAQASLKADKATMKEVQLVVD